MSNKTIHPWEWDVRVRDRNLRQGKITDKDVEKFLGGLADVADQADTLALPQPALGGHEDAAPAVQVGVAAPSGLGSGMMGPNGTPSSAS
jgi:hypothetical protein